MPEHKARVLIIDDQEANRYILRRILTHGGFAVDQATTGSDGLTQALSLPDVIIADVNLPDMLGYEVCRRLRSNPATTGIPVIQISASFLSTESKVQALEGGADSYLTQPIEPAVLLAQVHSLLRLRKAEALSSLSARQWQTTFDSLGEGLALVDTEGILLRANRTLLDQLQFVPSELEGRHLSTIFEARFDLPFADFLARTRADGSVELATGGRWFRLTFNPMDADPDSAAGAVLLVADITDHKKLQETLKMSERLAATGRLAHIIAHEINNPLEAMSNLLFLAIHGTPSTEPAHQFLQLATEELGRISEITKQVLAYHRQSKNPILTPASELIQSVLAIFRSQMLASGVVIDADIRCTLPISVHPGEIRQVFGNLISNALDALQTPRKSPGGRLRVRCTPALDPRSGIPGVCFILSDNGPGIPADIYPRIFEAFYTTKEDKGSGIGLWISSEVIHKHHGSMRVRTRTTGPYRGTLFSVFLPLPPDANT